jgi:hypothetical protein
MGMLGRLRFVASMAVLGLATAAQAQAVSEPAVKAAFLYKFLGYIEWPAQATAVDTPFVIGIAGADEVAGELERITAGRNVNGRRLAVRRLREGDPLRGLDALFVGRGEANAREMLRSVQRQGVLTISEGERGLELGSVINLVTLGDRVAFEVSLEAAERAGLGVSSRMLAVARRVVPKA